MASGFRKTPMPWFAPAKVNWFLEILGKREDGYHELVTFMSQVSIWDGFVFEEAPRGQIHLEIDDPTLDGGETNLVTKAVKAIWTRCGEQHGVRIRLYKRIPREAGLGGGSSDAAATLAGLNRFWGLGYSREQLVELASQLGSDVSFFLGGPSALCSGRGEICQDWPTPKRQWLVMVEPDFGLGTKAVYQALRLTGTHQKVDPFLSAWNLGFCDSLGRALYNRLEEPALDLEPQVGQWKQKLSQAGALGSMMTGSGSVIFGLFASAADAGRAAIWIEDQAKNAGQGTDPSRMTGNDPRPRSVKVVHTLAD